MRFWIYQLISTANSALIPSLLFAPLQIFRPVNIPAPIAILLEWAISTEDKKQKKGQWSVQKLPFKDWCRLNFTKPSSSNTLLLLVRFNLHQSLLDVLWCQADPSCFYFRISWILMERHWFYFFRPLHLVQGLRSNSIK